jgi:hypothetical protein
MTGSVLKFWTGGIPRGSRWGVFKIVPLPVIGHASSPALVGHSLEFEYLLLAISWTLGDFFSYPFIIAFRFIRVL